MNKFEEFVNNNINTLTSAKTLFKVFVCILMAALIFATIYDKRIMEDQHDVIVELKQRNAAADTYIEDLEYAIETQDVDIADVCGTDAYEEYNSWR